MKTKADELPDLHPALLLNNQTCSVSWLKGTLAQTLEYLEQAELEQPPENLQTTLRVIADCAKAAKLNLQYLRETGFQFQHTTGESCH